MTIEDRVRYAKAKIRNIIYYRLTVIPACCSSGDPQLDYSRQTYLHVLRQLRETLGRLILDMPVEHPDRDLLIGIKLLIPMKVKTDEGKDVIKRIRDYVDKQEKQGETQG